MTSNKCPPTAYPTSSTDAPDIPNPYYLVQKSRENKYSGQTQSFLQPDLNNAELSVPFAPSADPGIINENIVADAAFSVGGDSGFRTVAAADQVADAPIVDYTFSDWGATNFRRKLKQRRGGNKA